MKKPIIEIDGARYYADRPNDCRDCFFWKNNKRRCTLKEHNCYYLAAPMPKVNKCNNCPYARGRACVTLSCYKELAAMVEGKK